MLTYVCIIVMKEKLGLRLRLYRYFYIKVKTMFFVIGFYFRKRWIQTD